MLYNPQIMTNVNFIARNWRFLSFGFLLTFTCNIGQTFFIGLYNGVIKTHYGLSSGEFGALYGMATLCSAGLLVWIGRLVDRVDLKAYTLWVIGALAVACALMYAGYTVVTLGLALLLLRLCGQGLMPHITNTSMGRYFEAARGRAISIASMGMNTGQFIMPVAAAFLMAHGGWQTSWAVYGAALLLVVVPLTIYLLKDHRERHRRWEAEMTLAEGQTGEHSRMKSPLKDGVLRDKRFFILLPAYLSMPLFGTSLFFFQQELVDAKGWEPTLYAFSFPFLSAAMTLATLISGVVIDRIGSSMKVLSLMNLPFVAALLMLVWLNSPMALPAALLLVGMSVGFMTVISGTLWPEMYGTRALGTVRSFATAIMVLGSAASPVLVGMLYDAGVSVATSFIGFAIFMILAALLTVPLAWRQGR
jgi:MFS family permease